MLTVNELQNLRTIFVYANTYVYDSMSSYWLNRKYRTDTEIRMYELRRRQASRAIVEIKKNKNLIQLIMQFRRIFNTETLLQLESNWHGHLYDLYFNRDKSYDWITKLDVRPFNDMLIDTSISVEDFYTIWLLTQE